MREIYAYAEHTRSNTMLMLSIRLEQKIRQVLTEPAHSDIFNRISWRIRIYIRNCFRFCIRGPDGFFWSKKTESKISCLGTFKWLIIKTQYLATNGWMALFTVVYTSDVIVRICVNCPIINPIHVPPSCGLFLTCREKYLLLWKAVVKIYIEIWWASGFLNCIKCTYLEGHFGHTDTNIRQLQSHIAAKLLHVRWTARPSTTGDKTHSRNPA
jgi:hypothetical protein